MVEVRASGIAAGGADAFEDGEGPCVVTEAAGVEDGDRAVRRVPPGDGDVVGMWIDAPTVGAGLEEGDNRGKPLGAVGGAECLDRRFVAVEASRPTSPTSSLGPPPISADARRPLAKLT